MAVRGAEVGIVGKNRKIKKAGAPAYANAPVVNQTLNKLPVDPAAWVIHDLLDF